MKPHLISRFTLLLALLLSAGSVAVKAAPVTIPQAQAAHFCQLLINDDGEVYPLSYQAHHLLTPNDSLTVEQLFMTFIFHDDNWQVLRIFPHTADDGTSWQVLADWGGAAGGNLMQSMDSLNWHPTITLPAEAMGNIRLGFFVQTGLNTDNVYLHLDNVKVELDSARIPPVLDTFTVYINRVCRSCGENIPADYVVGEGRYEEGDTVSLEGLVQGEGVSFDFWILETGDTIFDNPYSFVIHSDRIITAYFSQNVGIDDVEGSDFLIYPNPATTTVTIELNESMDANTSLQVLDQQGRCVFIQAIKQSDNQTITIDVSRWAAGTYFVRIVNDSGAIVKKLILR